MIAAKSDEWAPAIGHLLPQNDYDAPKALALVGEAIKGQVQQSIRDTNPRSSGTLMLRKMFGNHPEHITARTSARRRGAWRPASPWRRRPSRSIGRRI